MQYVVLVGIIILVRLLVVFLVGGGRGDAVTDGQPQSFQSVMIDPAQEAEISSTGSESVWVPGSDKQMVPDTGYSDDKVLPIPIRPGAPHNYMLTVTREGDSWALSGVDGHPAESWHVSEQDSNVLNVTLVLPWRDLATRYSQP